MLMSTDRILVSHVGSLPRPPTLSELLLRQEAGETIDAAELARQVEIATTHVIDKQVEAGVDVGNDGEQSRVGFQTYVSRCLGGFGGANPSVRRHGIKSTSQAMPGRRNCVFRTPRGWRTRRQRCPMSSM
jgi:5-methyltetrahydropteroyltriglutamate--homocysteine methyltransferase